MLYSNIDLIIYLRTNAPVLTFYQENFIILQNLKVIRSIPSSSSACFTNHILSHNYICEGDCFETRIQNNNVQERDASVRNSQKDN